MSRFAFIGMGNMGSAILAGLLTAYDGSDIVFHCNTAAHAAAVTEKTGVKSASSNAEAAARADIVILAVKPQVYPAVLPELKGVMNAEKTLISLAPSWSIAALKDALGQDIRVVRAMPNTPAMLLEGMTGIAYEESLFSEEERGEIGRIFTSFGRVKKVSEPLMDAVTTVSGSSPAFVYMFIDALADAGVRCGLKKSDALEMAAQTVLGSAKMVLESGEHPAVLKDRVCSPGGTTIAGVAALEKAGFRGDILKGCEAVYDRCRGM